MQLRVSTVYEYCHLLVQGKEGLLGKEMCEQTRSRTRPVSIGRQAVGVGRRTWAMVQGEIFGRGYGLIYSLMASRNTMAIASLCGTN